MRTTENGCGLRMPAINHRADTTGLWIDNGNGFLSTTFVQAKNEPKRLLSGMESDSMVHEIRQLRASSPTSIDCSIHLRWKFGQLAPQRFSWSTLHEPHKHNNSIEIDPSTRVDIWKPDKLSCKKFFWMGISSGLEMLSKLAPMIFSISLAYHWHFGTRSEENTMKRKRAFSFTFCITFKTANSVARVKRV